MGEIIKLKLNKEFKRLYYSGRFVSHPLLVSYLKPNRRNVNRIGITTSKKVGNAVRRNRARRVILAAYRDLQPELPTGYDMVFVAREGTPDAKSTQVRDVMKEQLTKLRSMPQKKSGRRKK